MLRKPLLSPVGLRRRFARFGFPLRRLDGGELRLKPLLVFCLGRFGGESVGFLVPFSLVRLVSLSFTFRM
jgi:hypothetical protein